LLGLLRIHLAVLQITYKHLNHTQCAVYRPGGKLEGLRGLASDNDKRLEANSVLLNWLAENNVWVFDKSDWGQAPHSLAVAVDTVDENENEKAGCGMIANKEIKEGKKKSVPHTTRAVADETKSLRRVWC
jgi:hypothetical protein